LVDALHHPTVAIDGTGRITAVNAAWLALTGSPLGQGSASVRPATYLDVCDRTAGASSTYAASYARQAASGIRSVLDGRSSRFALDYSAPRDDPAARYTMRVTPLGPLGHGALITQMAVTPPAIHREAPNPPDLDPSRTRAAAELREAIAHDQIEVWFQPEYEIATGRLVAFEALARWRHPERGILLPGEFLPVAEEAGLMQDLGARAIRSACAWAARWLDLRPEAPIGVAVNLSAQQLRDPGLAWVVREALAATSLPPGLLCLEISETVLMDDVQAATRTLRTLRGCGVKLAVDDFGTGYSSLASLKRFPVDHVKIDRSFISGLGTDPEDTVIVSAVINLVHTLGFTLIAEGVETDDHHARLRALGCDYAQGFFWSPPLPPEEISLEDRPVAAPEPALLSDDEIPPVTPQAAAETMSVIAHELANRLTVIEGLADLAATTDDGDERGRILLSLSEQAVHAGRVVTAIGEMNAVEAGALQLERTEGSLRTIVERAVEAAGPGEGQHICIDVPDVRVTCDEVRIGQVFSNLLVNAMRYTPASARIRITAAVGPGVLAVHVTDDGPGIPACKVAGVFRKFGRGDRSKPGTGLGLFLSRGIARAHGGELSYRDADGGGADFVLELPADVVSPVTVGSHPRR